MLEKLSPNKLEAVSESNVQTSSIRSCKFEPSSLGELSTFAVDDAEALFLGDLDSEDLAEFCLVDADVEAGVLLPDFFFDDDDGVTGAKDFLFDDDDGVVAGVDFFFVDDEGVNVVEDFFFEDGVTGFDDFFFNDDDDDGVD